MKFLINLPHTLNIVFFFLNLKMVNDNETLERKNIDPVKRFMKIFHDHILNPKQNQEDSH